MYLSYSGEPVVILSRTACCLLVAMMILLIVVAATLGWSAVALFIAGYALGWRMAP